LREYFKKDDLIFNRRVGILLDGQRPRSKDDFRKFKGKKNVP